jgi:SH3-like domain-containing protein
MFKGKPKKKDAKEELIPVPVPALVAVLLNKENEKGSPLTEQEVLEIRDKAACIMMPISVVSEMEKSRGYSDLDPEYAWEQWQQARLELIDDENS